MDCSPRSETLELLAILHFVETLSVSRAGKDFDVTKKIPISKDGVSFDEVSCRRAGGYWVGPKGKEHKFVRFDDAVAALNLMEGGPRWRRRNKNGNWGIVSGVGWL